MQLQIFSQPLTLDLDLDADPGQGCPWGSCPCSTGRPVRVGGTHAGGAERDTVPGAHAEVPRDLSTAPDLQRSPGRVSIRYLLPLYYFSKMKTALFL